MREIHATHIRETVARLMVDGCCKLPEDLCASYEEAREKEISPLGAHALDQIIRNAAIARKECIPSCQDTGVAVVFLEVGQDVHIIGGDLEEAVNRGVAEGYLRGFLRKSTVRDPLFDRSNPGDNTPAVIHTRILPGEKIRILAAPKGFGSENKAKLKMLLPADGLDGVKRFVFESVRAAGADACPPMVVGVGIGGTFEKCALLAKVASLRDVSQANPDPRYADLERELRDKINTTGVGPMGFGGRHTCLKVNIESYATHIAGLPVAVNINCHAARHAAATL